METTREIRVPERFETETSIKATGRRVKLVFDASNLTNEQYAERVIYSTGKLGRDSWFSGKGYKDLNAVPDVIEVSLKPLGVKEKKEVVPATPEGFVGAMGKLNEKDRLATLEMMRKAGFLG